MATEAQWDKSESKTTVDGTKIPAGVNWEELRSRSLRPGGFGAERISIWPRLLNAKIPPSSSLQSVRVRQSAESEVNDGDTKEGLSAEAPLVNNATKPSAEHRDEHQIKLDTDRSFVLYPEESETHVPKDSLKSELNHLIVSIFQNRPKLNYFQGYHDIMTVIYLTLPQELQLACAEKLSLHRLRDSMLHSLEPVLGLLRVLKILIRTADPEYAKLLERDSPLPFYALSNLLTLFSHDMPTLPLIQHVFDYLLCRPPIAVVYLAAAFLLSRKEYIQSVEGQLEPFMFHPILSSLPALTEGFEQPHINGDPESMTLQPPSENFESKPAADMPLELAEPQSVRDTSKCESVSVSASPSLMNSTTSDNPGIGLRSIDANGETNQKLDDESSPDLDVYNRQLSSSQAPTPTDTTKQALFKPSPSPSPSLSPSRQSPVESRLASSSPSSLHLGENSVSPTSPIPLPKILSDSDSLYAQYPPSHPSLRLSSIMGPQSVIFTWSENFSDLPSDATAEAMTGRPELVVYPVGPEEAEEQEDSGGDTDTDSNSEYRNEKEKRSRRPKATREKDEKEARRKKRKSVKKKIRKVLGALYFRTRGQGVTHVDGRTMIAGAVVVLGVAMAVYGIKATGSSTGGVLGEGPDVHFLARHLPEHTHEYLQEELKKIAGVLVGVGTKFLKLGGVDDNRS